MPKPCHSDKPVKQTRCPGTKVNMKSTIQNRPTAAIGFCLLLLLPMQVCSGNLDATENQLLEAIEQESGRALEMLITGADHIDRVQAAPIIY